MELIIAVSSNFGGSEEIACLVCVRHEVAYVTNGWMYESTDVSADIVFAGVLTRHKDCVCVLLDAITCRQTQVVFNETCKKFVTVRSVLLQISPKLQLSLHCMQRPVFTSLPVVELSFRIVRFPA